jgi:hypothetical protein
MNFLATEDSMSTSIKEKVPDCVIYFHQQPYFQIKENRVIMSCTEQQKKHLNGIGITIQASDQSRFENKQYVKVDDPLFAKALIEVYFKQLRRASTGFVMVEMNTLDKKMNNLNIQD